MRDTITSAAAGLATGRTTAAALVEESLAAISAHGAVTNAFTMVDSAGARAAAEAVDRERALGVDRGLLHGIPISLKDLVDAAGVVTTAGSRVLRDRVAARDALVVLRLREAGAILIGRTNLHEFAFGTTSEHSAFGAVHHPADPTRSAGGSSGGSAAAVALGMGLGSIGTDTGGSIRVPAAACGIVGLKPTAGEVPLDGVIPLSASLDHVGPLTRTVEDAACLYAVLAGLTPFTVSPPPAGQIRLKRLVGYFNHPLDATVRTAFDLALAQLSAAGTHVQEAELPGSDAIVDTYVNIILPEAAHWHAPFLDTRADEYTPTVRSRILLGRTISALQYLEGQAARARLRTAVDDLLSDVDALVLPTMPIVAPPLGLETLVIEPGSREPIPVRSAMLKHTQLFNLTGHPAISLPLSTTSLPVGLQLVGRRGQTARLLDVAATLERIVACP